MESVGYGENDSEREVAERERCCALPKPTNHTGMHTSHSAVAETTVSHEEDDEHLCNWLTAKQSFRRIIIPNGKGQPPSLKRNAGLRFRTPVLAGSLNIRTRTAGQTASSGGSPMCS